MSDNPKTPTRYPSHPSNLEKSPDDWTTGKAPMTGAQAPYLDMLCAEFGPGLSKVGASKRIDALLAKIHGC